MANRTLSAKTKVPVTVRVPEELLHEIDECVQTQVVPISRNTWLLEAAVEKLRRIGNGSPPDGS